jgi:hypothetical protein
MAHSAGTSEQDSAGMRLVTAGVAVSIKRAQIDRVRGAASLAAGGVLICRTHCPS